MLGATALAVLGAAPGYAAVADPSGKNLIQIIEYGPGIGGTSGCDPNEYHWQKHAQTFDCWTGGPNTTCSGLVTSQYPEYVGYPVGNEPCEPSAPGPFFVSICFPDAQPKANQCTEAPGAAGGGPSGVGLAYASASQPAARDPQGLLGDQGSRKAVRGVLQVIDGSGNSLLSLEAR